MQPDDGQDLPDNLGERARSALGWQLLSQGMTTGVQMVVSIILARLLMPADFGVLAMAIMVTGLAGMFQDLGLGQALVQRREINHVHLASAFWGTLLMGLLLWGLMMGIAPAVGTFFREPRMAPVLRIIALSFLVTPFGAVPRAQLQRALDFRHLFYAAIAATLASSIVGVGMALTGHGYWSLVGAQLASVLAGTVAICLLTGYLPPLVVTLNGIKDLYRYGVGATGVGLFNYIAQQADYFVVGRWLNSTALGLYSRAFNLAHQPLIIVQSVAGPVMFPLFGQLQDDRDRAGRVLATSLTAVSSLTFPMLAIFTVIAPDLIPLLLGQQWSGSIVPAQVLALASMMRTVTHIGAMHPKGFGFVYEQVWRNGVYAAALTAAALLGSRWGVVGVSWGALAATVVLWALNVQLLCRVSGLSFGRYMSSLMGPAFCALIAAGAALSVRVLALHTGQGAWLTLVAATGAGVLLTGLLTAYSPSRQAREVSRGLLQTGVADWKRRRHGK